MTDMDDTMVRRYGGSFLETFRMLMSKGKAGDIVRWDSKRFIETFRMLMSKGKAGDFFAYSDVRKMRAAEFANTVALINQGYYETESGKKITFLSDAPMQQGTVFYDREFHVDAPKRGKTVVEVVNEDCLLTATRLARQGHRTAVLNMANRWNPGGSVLTGASAQEETLFRRTNLFRSLYQFASYASFYGLPMSACQYPLDSNFGGIYTPDAVLFREGEQDGYALMDEPVRLSFISVAAINHPELTDSGLIADYLTEQMKNKIRTILRIGLHHGHCTLVLGAFGCGAFHNPPRHVARLFHDVLREEEFDGKFELLVFAILDDHNSHRSHNPEGNFKPFAEEFAGAGRA